MSIYKIANSALFATDLLRRDRDGGAARLVAYGVASAPGSAATSFPQLHWSPLYADMDEAERTRVRERVLRLGDAMPTLEQMMDLLHDERTDRNHLAALTAGNAHDAWEAVSEFCGPENPLTETLADAVLWLWTRPVIGSQDSIVLTGRANPYLYETRADLAADGLVANLGGWREFEPHDAAMRELLARVEAMTADDFHTIEQGPDADERWEQAMEVATAAAEDHINEQQIAIAQMLAVGLLGLSGRRTEVELATLVVAGISLVGAVQATMLAEVLDPAVVTLLARDWPLMPP